MKLCTFEVVSPLGAVARVGVQSGSRIIDATAARIALLEQSLPAEAARRVGCAQVPADMIALIGCGQIALDWVEEGMRFVEQAACTHTSDGQATFYAETTPAYPNTQMSAAKVSVLCLALSIFGARNLNR